MMWVDAGGFMDSNELIDILIQFINKKIFLLANSVRVLVPFTVNQAEF